MAEAVPYLNLDKIAVTTRQALIDRVFEPLGGLAVVTLDGDPQAILAEQVVELGTQPQADDSSPWFWAKRSMRSDWPQPANVIGGDSLVRTDALQDLITELKTVSDPLMMAAGLDLRDTWTTVHGQKRVKTSDYHFDPDNAVTIWLGATAPGLKVWCAGTKYRIDALPPHAAIVWRGKLLSPDLPPTYHSVNYRRKERRYSFLNYDLNIV